MCSMGKLCVIYYILIKGVVKMKLVVLYDTVVYVKYVNAVRSVLACGGVEISYIINQQLKINLSRQTQSQSRVRG